MTKRISLIAALLVWVPMTATAADGHLPRKVEIGIRRAIALGSLEVSAPVAATAETAVAESMLMTDGPLTPFANVRVRTDENGYLLVSGVEAGATDGPLTPGSNVRVRTDENGYLRVALSGSPSLATGGTYKVQMATPGTASAAQGGGGTLADGTYGFRVVAVDPNGNTSLPGTEGLCVVSGKAGAGSCTVSWTAVSGAGSYRVYGQTASGEDRYVGNIYTASYIWTDPLNATIGALPTSNTAYSVSLGAPRSWFSSAQFYTDPVLANIFWGGNKNPAITTGAGNLAIGLQALQLMATGQNNTAIGWDSQMFNVGADNNTSLGEDALKNVLTGGNNNTGLGYTAGYSTTTGDDNVAIGPLALYTNQTGGQNTAVGKGALFAATTSDNTAVGYQALGTLSTGTKSTAVGQSAGHAQTTNGGGVFIGYGAGYNETGANKLFIDNDVRANEADGRAKALIYGVFDASPANQFVTINGTLASSVAQMTAGSATGLTVNDVGSERTQVYKVTLTSAAFVCNATTCDVTIGTLPANTRVIGADAAITTTFACTATCTTSTLSMVLGKGSGGAEYLASFDADAATGWFGDADAEMGTLLTRAAAIQGGTFSASSQAVVLRLTSGSGVVGNGSATNLSQGTVVVRLTTVVMP